MWISAWITAFFALFIVSGNCVPVTQESGPNSNDAVGNVPNRESSTTEENGSTVGTTLQEQNVMNVTESEGFQLEGTAATDRNEDKITLCSEEADEAESKDGKTKRAYDPEDKEILNLNFNPDFTELRMSEGNNGTKDDKEIVQMEADFIQHDYDYTIKSDSETRKKRDSSSSVLRKRRQSGETVPYPSSSRSRRDIPVYPANLVPANEHVAVEREEKEAENVRENSDRDEDEDEHED